MRIDAANGLMVSASVHADSPVSQASTISSPGRRRSSMRRLTARRRSLPSMMFSKRSRAIRAASTLSRLGKSPDRVKAATLSVRVRACGSEIAESSSRLRRPWSCRVVERASSRSSSSSASLRASTAAA